MGVQAFDAKKRNQAAAAAVSWGVQSTHAYEILQVCDLLPCYAMFDHVRVWV